LLYEDNRHVSREDLGDVVSLLKKTSKNVNAGPGQRSGNAGGGDA
jgi:hypothetical protein